MPFIEFKRRLRWADADAAGRLHFPRIFEIIEEAETEFLRELDLSLQLRRLNFDFPRVNINCNFLRVINLDAPFRLRFSVSQVGRTSIEYVYQVFDEDEKLAIEGTMTVVVMQAGKKIAIPSELRDALRGDSTTSE